MSTGPLEPLLEALDLARLHDDRYEAWSVQRARIVRYAIARAVRSSAISAAS